MMMAFSSVGKTWVALNAIWRNPSIPVLVFSMEMNARMLAGRLAGMELDTSTRDIEDRLKRGETVGELDRIATKFKGLIIDDTPGIKLKDASASFRQAEEKLGMAPRLVVWDYLELLAVNGLNGKAEQVDKIATQLREWTRAHDTRSLVLHQLNAESGGWQPLKLSSGRYGGYQPMDYVIGAYAPRLDPSLPPDKRMAVQNEIWFQLLKSRAGEDDANGVPYRRTPTGRIEPRDMPVFYVPQMPAQQTSMAWQPPPPASPQPEQTAHTTSTGPWPDDPRYDDLEPF
jgi:hypothetical protein